MKLTSLHFLTSYKCLYECDHCFVFSSPGAEGTMTVDFIKDTLQQAAELGSINEIYFEGGEPFLHYPLLIEAAKTADSYGMKIGLVSNAYFAETVEDAKLWLKPFAAMKDVYLSISEDEFHMNEEDKSTANLIQAAKELGIQTGTICIEGPKVVYDHQTPGLPIVGGGVRFRGRAVEKLSHDPSLPLCYWKDFDSCPEEDFVDFGRLHVDAYGNLFPCQGIIVGNLKKNTLEEIVNNYTTETNPIVSAIHKGGPAELLNRFKLDLPKQFLDACHLCYAARKQLLADNPEYLGPPQVYGL